MAAATLDDFMALNDQIAALVEAGVPIDVGLGKSRNNVSEALSQINALIARRVSQGQSLLDAVHDEPSLPGRYRSAVLTGLRSENLSVAISTWTRLGASIDSSWHAVRTSLRYPLVLCAIVYVGVIGLCLFLVPRFEHFFDSLGMQAGLVLQLLQAVRDSLPIWIAVPPVLLLVLYFWQQRNSSSELTTSQAAQRLSWLPGMKTSLFQQRCANFAELVATLLDSGVPLQESLRLAAASCGDRKLADGARMLADTLERGQPGIDCNSADVFPPFLRWALLESSGTAGTSRALRMAADVYQGSASRRISRLQLFAPVVACVVIGGGVTLLYGLALFVPISDMLTKLGS